MLRVPKEHASCTGSGTLTEQCLDIHGLDTQISMPTEKKLSDIGKQNESGNVFLNDLYEQEVDIRSNFSAQEILDIRTAVGEHVKYLAEIIGEIDPRFRVRKAIPVGSVREGTQIVRPCEYDFIITCILGARSQPGAVSILFYKYDRQLMFVTLEGKETRSLFYDCIGRKDHMKAAGEFPKRGLREVFRASVARAVILCSKRSVEKSTGTLTCKPSKPDTRGPACPVMFEWRGIISLLPLKISVDLCPALKVDWEMFRDSLQSIDCDVSADFKCRIHNIGSVLLMPKTENHFRITFTEAELLLTADLSEHRRKCYKLLKYVINGEPLPLQTQTSKIKYIFQDKTFLPSYALKLMIWNHQFTEHCSEEKDIGSCFSRILFKFVNYSQLKESLKHPVNSGVKLVGSELSKDIGDGLANNTTLHSVERIRRVLKGFKMIQGVTIEKYDFETFCHKLAIRGLGRYK